MRCWTALHSDRGTQYASAEHQALLAKHGLVGSMSRKGNCWDNAVMERFFLSLEMERVWHKNYANHFRATNDIADCFVGFYNAGRLHSKLGNLSLTAFERESTSEKPIKLSEITKSLPLVAIKVKLRQRPKLANLSRQAAEAKPSQVQGPFAPATAGFDFLQVLVVGDLLRWRQGWVLHRLVSCWCRGKHWTLVNLSNGALLKLKRLAVETPRSALGWISHDNLWPFQLLIT